MKKEKKKASRNKEKIPDSQVCSLCILQLLKGILKLSEATAWPSQFWKVEINEV